jgi:hypothetical protein
LVVAYVVLGVAAAGFAAAGAGVEGVDEDESLDGFGEAAASVDDLVDRESLR